MSYHRTREPGPAGRSSSMTVCTNEVACGDLVEDGLRRSARDASRSARVCSPPGIAGSSCRAARGPSGARRSPTAVWGGYSARRSSWGRIAQSRTYVPMLVGRWGPERGRALLRRINEGHGEWRSLVAHPAGGRAVAGSNPVSPMKSRRFRTLRLAANAGESREKTAILGWPFSSVPGCSRHAGPQKDRSDGRKDRKTPRGFSRLGRG